MQNRFTSWSWPSTLAIGFLLSTTHLQAMNAPDRDYLAVNSRIATHMETEIIQATPGENTLVCPLGPKQILADVSQIADEDAKAEIQKFTGTDFEFVSYRVFVAQLPQNTEFPKVEKIKTRWGYEYTPKVEKNAFFNGHFILSNDTFELNDERVQHLRQLKAEVTPVDFSNPKKSADYVNDIVDTHTNHLIPTILTEDAFSDDPVALVLLSTLYMNNSWTVFFDDRYIPFKGAKGKNEVKGFGEDVRIPHHQNQNETTVMIPASGGTSLIVRMQHNGTVSPVTHSHIKDFLTSHTKDEIIDFKMPAFTVENTLDLKSLLKTAMPQLMGGQKFVIDMFQEKKLVYIGTFIQKNKLDVTKNGLEGASATAMTMSLECAYIPMENKKVTIDQPFSFAVVKMLRDNQWLTLFTGQILDPIAPAEED